MIFIYAGVDLILPTLGHFSQIIFILTGLIFTILGFTQKSLRFPVFLLLATIPVQLASWYFAPEIPDLQNEGSPQLDRLARWFIFIFIAYWLIGRKASPLIMWTCFVIGLLISPFFTGEGINELVNAMQGNRTDFGLRNAQHTGMFFGVAIVGLYSVLLYQLIRPSIKRKTGIMLAILFILCTLGLIASQTRGAWLSTGFAIVISSALTLAITFRPHRSNYRKKNRSVFTIIGILIFALFLLFLGAPKERFLKESTTIEKFTAGDIAQMKNDSVGVRVKSWASALSWIEERPLIGWGRMGSPGVIHHSEYLPTHLKPRYGHLHNSYLDIMVQYGFLGLAIFLVLIAWLFLFSWKSWREKTMPNEVFIFIISFIVYWLFVNTTESYMLYSSGRFVLNLVVGGALAYHLNSIKTNSRPRTAEKKDDMPQSK